IREALVVLCPQVEEAQAWIVRPRPTFNTEPDVHKFDPEFFVTQAQRKVIPDTIGIHPDLSQPIAVGLQKGHYLTAGILTAPGPEFDRLGIGLAQRAQTNDGLRSAAADVNSSYE